MVTPDRPCVNHAEVADLVAASPPGMWAFVHGVDEWRVWGAEGWRGDDTARVHREVGAVCRETFSRRHQSGNLVLDERGCGSPDTWSKVQKVMEGLDAFATRVDDWDAVPTLIGLPERQVFDVTSGEIRPANPSHRITRELRTMPGETGGDVLEGFLEEVLEPDLAAFVMRVAGAAVLGAPWHETSYWFYGLKGSGKSTLAEALLHAAGSYGIAADPSILAAEPKREPTHFRLDIEVGRLAGMRLVLCGDVRDKARTSPMFKDVTGSEWLIGRAGNKDLRFRRTQTFFATANALPDGLTPAELDRITPIPFLEPFRGTEREDPTLKRRLRLAAPAIVARMLHHAREVWRARRWPSPPPACRDAKAAYEEQAGSPVDRFVNEVCTLDSSACTPTADLFIAFANWCKEARVEALSQGMLAAALLERHGIARRRVRGADGDRGRPSYLGIELRGARSD